MSALQLLTRYGQTVSAVDDARTIFDNFDVIANASSVNQRGNRFSPAASVTLTHVRANSSTAKTLEFRVWDVATTTLIGNEDFAHTGSGWETFALTTPLVLGADFIISVIADDTSSYNLRQADPLTVTTSPGITWVEGRVGSTSPNPTTKRKFPTTTNSSVLGVDGIVT